MTDQDPEPRYLYGCWACGALLIPEPPQAYAYCCVPCSTGTKKYVAMRPIPQRYRALVLVSHRLGGSEAAVAMWRGLLAQGVAQP